MPIRWFIDFDDTLATGSLTWSVDYALPKLIQENNLVYDADVLSKAVLIAQEKENQNVDYMLIVNELFDTMHWPYELQKSLMSDVMANFRPELYDDVIPFLDSLKASNQPVYVISNNPQCRNIAESLGISAYFSGFFSPEKSQGLQPKPHRSLWDNILSGDNQITVDESRMIGDDPWSDGLFAENCGLQCWIIDRGNRYQSLYEDKPYTWVKSLLEIPVNQT